MEDVRECGLGREIQISCVIIPGGSGDERVLFELVIHVLSPLVHLRTGGRNPDFELIFTRVKMMEQKFISA